MSFCGKCGTEMPDGARFCMMCGHPMSGEASVPGPETPVNKSADTPVADPVSRSMPVSDTDQKKSRKSPVKGIIAAIAAFILIILIGVIFFNPGKNDKPVGTGDSLTQMIDQAEINVEYISE